MKILSKDIIAQTSDTTITKFRIHAPLIASKVEPGQFVVVMADERGERIPLTVVESEGASGTIVLIVQEMGFSTRLLGKLNAGGALYAIVGPLGHASEIKNYGKVILVGGGVGVAEIYPMAKALKDALNHITTILGSRTKALLILEKELKAISDESYVTTDDGSYGRKGFVTDALNEILEKQNIDFIYAVGPIPMMQRVSAIGKKFNVKTTVSLNALMVDATGMCGGCRVKIGDEVKFSCVDGPEFNGHKVDWDELIKRSRVYTDKEKHICRLNNL